MPILMQDVAWHDSRDARLQRLDLSREGLVGLVLNQRAGGLLGRLAGFRHWLAIKRLGGAWWAACGAGSARVAAGIVRVCQGCSGAAWPAHMLACMPHHA